MIWQRRTVGGTSLATVAITVLAACGGSSGTPTSTTAPPRTDPTGSTTSTSSAVDAPNTTSLTQPAPVWRPLLEAPIAGRIGAGVVWTGREMLVWGGLPRPADPDALMERVGDGAAYDPATRSWRTLAPPPPGVLGIADEGAVWTGDEAVFWTGNMPDGPASGAVYNPGNDTWRPLPDGPLTIREGYTSVWTGSEMVILGGHGGKNFSDPVAAAVDPRTGAWRLLPGLKDLVGLLPHQAFWDGREVLVSGSLALCPEEGGGCSGSRPIFVAYDPKTDVRREIDLAGTRFEDPNPPRPIGWTGTELLFAAYDEPSLAILGYAPATGTWRTGASTRCTPSDSGYAQSAWLGDRFLGTCGDELLLYDVADDTWDVVDTDSSPLGTHYSSAIAWTGTELIVWSGGIEAPYNPTPNEGATITLAT